MKLRASFAIGLSVLCMLFLAPFLAGTAAGAYPVTTCSTISVSTTTPLPGEAITVSGTNFNANASVHLVLRPGNTSLTTVTSDARGSFSTKVTMPASITNRGHFLIYATSGFTRSSSCPADPSQTLSFRAAAETNSGATTGGSGGLSSTGIDVAGLLALAGVLIGGGVLLNRRKTHAGSR